MRRPHCQSHHLPSPIGPRQRAHVRQEYKEEVYHRAHPVAVHAKSPVLGQYFHHPEAEIDIERDLGHQCEIDQTWPAARRRIRDRRSRLRCDDGPRQRGPCATRQIAQRVPHCPATRESRPRRTPSTITTSASAPSIIFVRSAPGLASSPLRRPQLSPRAGCGTLRHRCATCYAPSVRGCPAQSPIEPSPQSIR